MSIGRAATPRQSQDCPPPTHSRTHTLTCKNGVSLSLQHQEPCTQKVGFPVSKRPWTQEGGGAVAAAAAVAVAPALALELALSVAVAVAVVKGAVV